MKILLNSTELKKVLERNHSLGFVPTMGSIHRGHQYLISKSQNECKRTLVSIFVNPTQFNNKHDLRKYPRNINKDLNKTIMNAKPPIFWKDKEVIKLQIKNWTPEKIKEVIYNLNKLEVQVKKISFNQLHLISDFILDKSSLNINN